MKVLVVLVLALATASAGLLPKLKPVHPKDMKPKAASIQGRITNGQQAEEGQFPYQVGLSFSSSSGSWWCGGSLIEKTWVLTAAHCTSGATEVIVYLGATIRTQPSHTAKVQKEKLITHSSYNSLLLRHDIAMIEIPAVALSNTVSPINLPKQSNSYSSYEGVTAIASGYGLESDSSNSVSAALNYAELTVIANDICADVYGSLVVTKNILCTQTANAVSTCSGDSGGPLVTDGVQIGLVSFGSSAGCEKGYPNGFTRLSEYLDWIVKNMNAE